MMFKIRFVTVCAFLFSLFASNAFALTVNTDNIADGAVTGPKIANGAVTDSKISGTINVNKLGTYAGVKIVHKGAADGINSFNSVLAALNSITDATSANRYLIKIMPGNYAESFSMKSFVDVAGSGEENTVITGPGPDTPAVSWAVENAVLENLSLTGAPALAVTGGRAEIRRAKITLNYNGYNGIELHAGALNLRNSSVVSNIPGNTVWSSSNTTTLISDSEIEINDSTPATVSACLYIHGDIVVNNTKVNCTVNNQVNAVILFGQNSKITNSEITASGRAAGAIYAGYGSLPGNVLIQNVRTICSGDPAYYYNAGIFIEPGNTVAIHNSIASGGAGVKVSPGSSFKAANSQLIGGHNGAAGNDKVINCYDGDFNPIPNL